MSIIPDPVEAAQLRALYAGNLLVDTAEAAIRHYQPRTVAEAEHLLLSWPYTTELTEREVRAVLARFVADDPTHTASGPGGVL